MTILDSFYLIFETETKALDTADEKIKQFKEHAVDSLKEIALGFVGIFAAEKLLDGIFENAEMIEQLGKTAKMLDVNVSDLDAWGQAVKRAGGTSEGFQQSIQSLNMKLAVLEAHGKSGGDRVTPFFKELGMSALDAHHKLKPIMELLPEIAAGMSRMSNMQSAGVGRRLGLDEGTIRLLQEGRVAVENHIREMKALGTVTQQNVEVASKFEDQWKDTQQIFRGGAFVLADIVLPALTEVLHLVQVGFDYLAAHKERVIGFFAGIGTAVALFYLPSIVAAAIATTIAIAPFLAIGAAIAAAGVAFGFFYDDLNNFLQGNKSVIGELVKKWPMLGVVIKEVAYAVVALGQVFSAVLTLVVGLFEHPKRAIENFGTALLNIGKTFLSQSPFIRKFFDEIKLGIDVLALRFPQVGRAVTVALRDIKSAFDVVSKDFQEAGEKILVIWNAIAAAIAKVMAAAGIGQKVEGAGSWIASKVRGAANWVTAPSHTAAGQAALAGDLSALNSDTAAGQAALAQANAPIAFAALPGGAGAAGANVTNNVTVGPTTVNTQASDPQAVSKAVGDTLQDHISTALNHYADGVQG